jgi:hypothetical protein
VKPSLYGNWHLAHSEEGQGQLFVTSLLKPTTRPTERLSNEPRKRPTSIRSGTSSGDMPQRRRNPISQSSSSTQARNGLQTPSRSSTVTKVTQALSLSDALPLLSGDGFDVAVIGPGFANQTGFTEA